MTDTMRNGPVNTLSDRSTAELVKLASEQISKLVRDELRLARTELAEKAKHASIGAGLFGGGTVVALYGVAALLAAVVIGLAHVMPAWLAAALVGVVLLAVAAVLALAGRSRVRRAAPPVPENAVRSAKADIETVTEAVRERGAR